MKTNPLTSLLNKAKKGFCSLLNLYRKHPSLIRIVFTILALFSFFVILSIYLPSCKSPATLTSDTQHHARDSTRHATIQRIETHDTIVLGLPLHYHKKYCRDSNGKAVLEPFAGGNLLPNYLPLIQLLSMVQNENEPAYIAIE